MRRTMLLHFDRVKFAMRPNTYRRYLATLLLPLALGVCERTLSEPRHTEHEDGSHDGAPEGLPPRPASDEPLRGGVEIRIPPANQKNPIVDDFAFYSTKENPPNYVFDREYAFAIPLVLRKGDKTMRWTRHELHEGVDKNGEKVGAYEITVGNIEITSITQKDKKWIIQGKMVNSKKRDGEAVSFVLSADGGKATVNGKDFELGRKGSKTQELTEKKN